MSKIQIKRYNGSTSQWENQFPITKAQHIVDNTNSTTIFDTSDKIKIAYLPDAVFDSLYYAGSNTGDVDASGPRINLASKLVDAYHYADDTLNRDFKGHYYVISAAGTINGLTGIQASTSTNYSTEYVTLQFRMADSGYSASPVSSSGALEVGDWFVIDAVSGAGTVGSPWVFTASIVSNTYEQADTSVYGITRLSSQTVWANLAGNNVITDAKLKALVDGQNYSVNGHTHLLAAGATDVTATASELNLLDGELITTTELNYLSGVTSAIQTQLNGKAATSHTHTVANITDLTATASELNVLDGITSSTAELNILDGVTADAAEINKLDGMTASTTELNYLVGVTSAIQTQLNGKQATITGGATTITSSNLTASRALVSDGSGKVAVSAVTSTELGYLSGVTSAVQTQLTNLANRVRVYYDGTPTGMVTDDLWFDAV